VTLGEQEAFVNANNDDVLAMARSRVPEVEQRLAVLRARMARAGGDTSAVRIVAVTKTFGPDAVIAAGLCGLTDFGRTSPTSSSKRPRASREWRQRSTGSSGLSGGTFSAPCSATRSIASAGGRRCSKASRERNSGRDDTFRKGRQRRWRCRVVPHHPAAFGRVIAAGSVHTEHSSIASVRRLSHITGVNFAEGRSFVPEHHFGK